jgi:ribulose-phosphate 3-epimerase
LWLDLSLWSADLANLESDIRRLERWADSFHLDVADGHYVSTLLFFPDLVARLRSLTKVPFHVHLQCTRPLDLAGAFLDAGADRITIPIEIGKRASAAVDYIREHGRAAGLSLELDTPVRSALAFRGRIDTLLLMGTPMGVKGRDLDERACDRVSEARALLEGQSVQVVCDGGIREHTVPLLRASGAEGIVPGSLVCASADPAATHAWLKQL